MNNYISFLIKFLFRLRYWVILAPILVALAVFNTVNFKKTYTATSTIYTGIITGVNILSESGVTVTSSTQSTMMSNLLNITTADQTLKNVSLRLYARCMVHGDLEKDNKYIQADHFRNIYNHGKSIHHLIDKNSPNDSINEANTYQNLLAYENNSPDNYVYGIYLWNLPYFNRNALKTIQVERDGNSDMIEFSYTTDDPGVAYQTLCILNEEFINQYQLLRFGETNNVIEYFERELKRAAKELGIAEDSLTHYRVDKRVINYSEETEQVAALNTEYELKYWTYYQDNKASEHVIAELEKRMGFNTELFRKNTEFLSDMQRITYLNNKLTLSDMDSGNRSVQQKDSLQKELQIVENKFQNFANNYGSLKYSKEGLANESVVQEWLNELLAFEKTKAQLESIKERKNKLDEKYVHFAPIGSTLNRKERSVSIAEKEYFAIMNALNSARLRQKSLQMTSATLKVMDEPVFPVSSEPSNRKKLTLAAALATFIFVLFFSLLVELLDHTLHTKLRVEMIAKGKAVGAFIHNNKLRYRRYKGIYEEISTKTLANFVTTYFKPEKNNIVNIISHDPQEGKSYITEQLATQFTEQGMEVKRLSWHTDFKGDAQAFVQSLDILNFNPDSALNTKDTVILVEYPSLRESSLSPKILKDVSLNLLVVDSRRTWKNTDQQLFERTQEMADNTPVFFVLNYTNRSAAEDFNGLMPPYTFFRKLFYRISQLGLTAQDKHKYV